MEGRGGFLCGFFVGESFSYGERIFRGYGLFGKG